MIILLYTKIKQIRRVKIKPSEEDALGEISCRVV